MAHILIPTSGPDDWRQLLADPDKHWKTGYSARTLAHCWEDAKGFPPEVTAPFTRSTELLLTDLTPLLVIPEFKVALPGGGRASQNDIFVLGRSSSGLVPIMVEGKVNESFGPTLGEWLKDASDGKEKRLDFLLNLLDLTGTAIVPNSTRYQLLHRTASAIIMGEQYHAVASVLLIHSFDQSPNPTGWPDYEAFLKLFGVTAQKGVVQRIGSNTKIPLFGVWVVGDPTFLTK
jgi:hypothetical protein